MKNYKGISLGKLVKYKDSIGVFYITSSPQYEHHLMFFSNDLSLSNYSPVKYSSYKRCAVLTRVIRPYEGSDEGNDIYIISVLNRISQWKY